MLGNIVKHFEGSLVRKALYNCSPHRCTQALLIKISPGSKTNCRHKQLVEELASNQGDIRGSAFSTGRGEIKQEQEVEEALLGGGRRAALM